MPAEPGGPGGSKARPEPPKPATRQRRAVAPRSTGDYSGTPLPRKLGIKPGTTIAFLDAPDGFDETIGTLPDGVEVRRRAQGALDVVVLFVARHDRLADRFGTAAKALVPDGGLWVAWPKKRSGVPTDLDFQTVQAIGLGAGLVDNKSCAIDDTWQALRFVVRLADRPARR